MVMEKWEKGEKEAGHARTFSPQRHRDSAEGGESRSASGRSSAKGSGQKTTSNSEAALMALRAWKSRFTRMAKRPTEAPAPDLWAKLKIKH
jgi:hypothetical protein